LSRQKEDKDKDKEKEKDRKITKVIFLGYVANAPFANASVTASAYVFS
jgi:hypothetical protein